MIKFHGSSKTMRAINYKEDMHDNLVLIITNDIINLCIIFISTNQAMFGIFVNIVKFT